MVASAVTIRVLIVDDSPSQLLGLQGVLLTIIGAGGTIPYRNTVILAMNNKAMPVWLGWVLALVGLVVAVVLAVVLNV